MVRIIRVALLSLMCSGAQANDLSEWVLVDRSPGGGRYYIDPRTLQQRGGNPTIWQVLDLATHRDGVRSIRYLAEYDCKNKRVRKLTSSTYPGPVASGGLIRTMNSVSEWSGITPSIFTTETNAPGISTPAIMKTVCNDLFVW